MNIYSLTSKKNKDRMTRLVQCMMLANWNALTTVEETQKQKPCTDSSTEVSHIDVCEVCVAVWTRVLCL